MQLVHCDPVTWRANALIEGWNSLIWTERWSTAGEFELKTSMINETMPLMNEGHILGLLESRDLMIVEDRQINQTAKGPELTVTGRSMFGSLLSIRSNDEGRTYQESVPPNATRNVFGYGWRNPYEAVMAFGYLSIGNATEEQIAYAGQSAYTAVGQPLPNNVINSMMSWLCLSYCRAPTGDYTDPNSEAIAWQNFWATTSRPDPYYNHPETPLAEVTYDYLVELLKDRNRGLLFNKPNPTGTTDTVWFVCLDPNDRTPANTQGFKPVVFDQLAGHVDKVSYLWAIKDFRNIAYVSSPLGFQIVPAPGVSASIAGTARRVLQVDASDMDKADDNKTVAQSLTARGLQELHAVNKAVIADVTISANNPYKYGYYLWDAAGTYDYSLGDYVWLQGQYGVDQMMQVTEHIRSQDSSGNKSEYPTLTAVDYLL